MYAHHTQATLPGWRFISQASGSGTLSGGGIYTSYVDPPTGGFTLVVYKPMGGQQESATFTLSGPAASVSALHGMKSTGEGGDGAVYSMAGAVSA